MFLNDYFDFSVENWLAGRHVRKLLGGTSEWFS